MALAKMVGLDVTPRTPSWASSASRPLVRNDRLRLSIQGLWPCWSNSSCSLVIGRPLYPFGRPPGPALCPFGRPPGPGALPRLALRAGSDALVVDPDDRNR